jgi:hypothetical protein
MDAARHDSFFVMCFFMVADTISMSTDNYVIMMMNAMH